MWKIFILYENNLFARGMEQLLKDEGGGEVVGMAENDKDPSSMIATLNPNLVLLESGKNGNDSSGLLFQLLQNQSLDRVARVCLEDGSTTLYAARRLAVNGTKELLNSILDPMTFRVRENEDSRILGSGK